MIATLQVLAVVFAVVAALIHVVFFVLESVLWPRPSTWRRFGLSSQSDADVVEPMAFNQGFYNLFLALGTGLGLFLLSYGNAMGGKWILLVTLSSMVLASLVLVVSSRRLWRAALIQGVAPLLAILFLLWAVALHAPLMVI